MMKQQSSHWWWFDNQNNSKRSPWLQSTLADLDHKTEAMLKLIETDADSFAQRAEMYYKKRPELINMVEEFYRAHRSLAERYDQVKSESGTRVLTTLCSPFSSTKYQLEKSTSEMTNQTYDSCSEVTNQIYDSCSETCDTEESAESEVDDPEQEDEEEYGTPVHERPKEEEVSSEDGYEELRKLKEEISRLEDENRVQGEQLKQKDEEKREVIRQLSMTVDVLKEENVKLRKSIAKDSPKRHSPFELNKLKEGLFGKFFNGSQKYPVVAL